MRELLWFNMFTITAAIIVSLSYIGSLGLNTSITPGFGMENVPKALTWLTFFQAFSKIAFAYAGQFIYFEFMAEMKKPEDFPKAMYRLAGPYQLTVYLIAACVGYHLKGQLAKGLMVDWIPYNAVLRFGALLLFLHVIIVYLIKAQILAKALHRALNPATYHKRDCLSNLKWFCITTCLIIFCVIIAEVIPFFDDLTGLVGAFLVPTTCWLLPIAFFVIIRYRNNKSIHILEWPILIFIFALGLVLSGIGTYANVVNIIQNWATYGYPFSCNCQGIWNTCACSASHTAMVC